MSYNGLEFSHRARKNMGLLYESYQDYQFFIEDKEDKISLAYKNLINNIFNGKFQIRKVHTLYNKPAVLQAEKENTDKNNFYIVDKDLNWLAEQPYEVSNNLIELERYCFESYFIDEQTYFRVFKYYIDEEELKELYNEWEQEVVEKLKYIFLIAVISMKYKLGEVITGKGQFYDSKTGCIRETELHNKISQIRTKFESNHPHLNFDDELRKIERDFGARSIKKDLVSGKNLFFTLIEYTRTKKNLNKHGLNDTSLMRNFVESVPSDEWGFIKVKVLGEEMMPR